MLRWAHERAGLEAAECIPRLMAWEHRERKSTLKQIEHFAKTVHAPVGYLFLQQPPVETIPIPDFRTADNKYVGHPSSDLLET